MDVPCARTVLVVDDNVAIRRELCETLTKYDLQVCAEATNGREAIELARTCRPEVVILDMSMPVMGGLDAALELRKLLPDSRIILFTLFADTVTGTELKARGIDIVISKNGRILMDVLTVQRSGILRTNKTVSMIAAQLGPLEHSSIANDGTTHCPAAHAPIGAPTATF